MLKFATNAILSFSALPLKIITWVGFLSVLVSFAFIGRTLYQYFFNSEALVLGWASLSILICFFSGVILLSIGMLGIYIAKIHAEVQGRPLYLIKHSANFERAPR
jgi:dolichol-phosphate mannosyltransferase